MLKISQYLIIIFKDEAFYNINKLTKTGNGGLYSIIQSASILLET